MIATLTSKGQVTLPKNVRDKMHLHAGDQLEFLCGEDGRWEIIPKRGSLREMKQLFPPPRHGITLADMEKAIVDGAGAHDRH